MIQNEGCIILYNEYTVATICNILCHHKEQVCTQLNAKTNYFFEKQGPSLPVFSFVCPKVVPTLTSPQHAEKHINNTSCATIIVYAVLSFLCPNVDISLACPCMGASIRQLAILNNNISYVNCISQRGKHVLQRQVCRRYERCEVHKNILAKTTASSFYLSQPHDDQTS